MSIAIAEAVKIHYLRRKRDDDSIRQLSGFEDIVSTTIIDKSALLTELMNVEIYFFSRKKNESFNTCVIDIISLTKKQKDLCQEQYFTWVKNNHLFGQAIDNTKNYTD